MVEITPSRRKTLLLLFLGIAVFALFLLAGGLPKIKLSPGVNLVLERTETPQPNGDDESVGNISARLPQGDSFSVLSRILLWLLILLTVYAIIFEHSEFLKRVLGALMGLIGTLILVRILSETEVGELFQPLDPVTADSPIKVFAPPEAGEPATYVIFLIGFTIVLALITGVYLAWRRLRWQLTPEEKIRLQAKEALRDISSGLEIENTIIRCYHQMTQTLSQERGITREESMTPREFERHLLLSDFPGDYVSTLTRLFEKVRYGGLEITPEEEKDAIRSLEMIVHTGDNP